MSRPATHAFSDLQTVEDLAATLGIETSRAETVLQDARIVVCGRVFSRSALLAALGSKESHAADDVSPSASTIRLFADLGLEIFELVTNRGLTARTRPRRADAVVHYSAVALDVRDEMQDADALFAGEDFEISSALPRSIRVFTAKRAHAGVTYFTVASPLKLSTDFVVFINLEASRGWMLPTEWVRDHVNGQAKLDHASVHTTGSLRFGFPSRRSTYDLENRLVFLSKGVG